MEPFELILPGEGKLSLIEKRVVPSGAIARPGTSRLVVDSDVADMQFELFPAADFACWRSRYQSRETLEYAGRANVEVIELSIAFKNHFVSSWDGVGQPTLKALEFNFCYAPFVNNKAVLVAGEIYETYDFHLSRAFLAPYAAVYDELKQFLDKVEKKEACTISLSRKLTREMHRSLVGLLEFECHPAIYLHTYTSRLQVFLTLAMELVCQKTVSNLIKLPRNAREIAEATKNILDQDIMNPPTIEQLSKLTMTNILAVQNAFKNQFNKTIHEHSNESRIAEAKKLLLNTTFSIDQIAYATGYANRQGLIKLFNTQLHCSPTEYRKKFRK
jgi:AraC-like DNA-binding protein